MRAEWGARKATLAPSASLPDIGGPGGGRRIGPARQRQSERREQMPLDFAWLATY